ncbi:MAG: efflux RND transporter periplasmic adaptor subunit, partial [Proteobacteria bacterium]|nr:efflux RND transporter periplasmic adaptor subunit [Pseudomonadota bacterium]
MKILSTRRIALVLLLAAVSSGGYYAFSGSSGASKPAGKGGKPPTPVLVATVSSRTIPINIETIGTIQALSTVAIKSRVDGQIMETAFTEGAIVKKGDPLFRIDPRPFQAKLRAAEANLVRDQAALGKAKSDFARYQSLSDKGFSSQQKYEEARAAMNGLTATIKATQAAIDIAKLDLEFTTVRAPISGRTGSVLVDAGNLVKANDAQPLVVINETDPILAEFSVPEAHLVEIKRRAGEGSLAV